MVTYKVIKEMINNRQLGSYTAYGISVYSAYKDKEIMRISDVFLRKSDADRLVEQCNQLELDPVHLLQVIEDFLTARRN